MIESRSRGSKRYGVHEECLFSCSSLGSRREVGLSLNIAQTGNPPLGSVMPATVAVEEHTVSPWYLGGRVDSVRLGCDVLKIAGDGSFNIRGNIWSVFA